MPGFLINSASTITCSHPPGKATPTAVFPRVLVAGQPVVIQTTPYTVAGCALASSGSAPPCATASWTSAATRVFANGQPVVLLDSKSNCLPTGTPLIIMNTQGRVTGM